MAFVSFEDCIRVESRWAIDAGGQIEITLWGRKLSGSVAQADVDEAAESFDAWADAYLLPLVIPQISYVETYARDMTAEISYQALNDTSAGAGTRAGSPCDAHTAIVVQRKSGLVGRSANGRIYGFGAATADRADIKTWGSALLADWEDAMEASNNVWDIDGFLPIIASPTLRVSTGQTLLSTFEILSWVASPNLAAYRGRS